MNHLIKSIFVFYILLFISKSVKAQTQQDSTRTTFYSNINFAKPQPNQYIVSCGNNLNEIFTNGMAEAVALLLQENPKLKVIIKQYQTTNKNPKDTITNICNAYLYKITENKSAYTARATAVYSPINEALGLNDKNNKLNMYYTKATFIIEVIIISI